jgi:hypothetical protein
MLHKVILPKTTACLSSPLSCYSITSISHETHTILYDTAKSVGPRYLWLLLRTIACHLSVSDTISIFCYEIAAVRDVDPETLADVVSVRSPTRTLGQRWHRVE